MPPADDFDDAVVDAMFVVAPHSLLLDIAGPAEAFRLANLNLVERGRRPRFRLRYAGHVPTATTSVGVALSGLEPLPATVSGSTWVIVAGQPSAHVGRTTRENLLTAQWLDRTLRAPLAMAGAAVAASHAPFA